MGHSLIYLLMPSKTHIISTYHVLDIILGVRKPLIWLSGCLWFGGEKEIKATNIPTIYKSIWILLYWHKLIWSDKYYHSYLQIKKNNMIDLQIAICCRRLRGHQESKLRDVNSLPNSAFGDFMLIPWKWLCLEYLHNGNQQIFKSMLFCFLFPRELVVKHLPAQGSNWHADYWN